MRLFSERKQRERRKSDPDEPTFRERFHAFREQRALCARQRAYADQSANDAYKERPRGGGHGLMSPVPYDPGGFSRDRQVELGAELARQCKGEGGE
jgi:hypothetical protein